MKDTVYVIDISNFIHRAFHTYGDLQTSDGFPTGAIYGTLSMLLNFIDKYKPKHMLVCYDPPNSNLLRKEIYPEYKANRTKIDEISAEEMIIKHLIKLMNIPSVEVARHEADDLIATAVNKLKDDMNIVIITGDKDMLQLIGPNVKILDTMKNIWYDESEAFKKFGVKPSQISDYLAIVGDSSDNIPGISGIGPKGAATLLAVHESLEDIYNNIDTITPTLKKKLETDKSMGILSKALAVLNHNIDVDISQSSVKYIPTINQEILRLIDKLEFKNMKVRLELMWQEYE